jgi:hypothetical protein
VGREGEGPAAGPNAPPKLIDATGKTYRTIGAPATAGVTGRRATVLFQAIKPDAGSITLVFEGIRVGSFRHEGVWQASHTWDGERRSTIRQTTISTLPQPFGIGTIQIDGVSHVLEGTIIHGHFEGYTPKALAVQPRPRRWREELPSAGSAAVWDSAKVTGRSRLRTRQ